MRSISTNIDTGRVASFAHGCVLVVLLLAPIAIVARGISISGTWPSWYWLLQISNTVLPTYLANSGWVLVGSIFVAFALGTGPAWLTSRYSFAGRRFAVFLQCLPLTFSASEVGGLYNEAWSNPFFTSRAALALILGSSAAPWVFLLLRAALGDVPALLRDSARTLGSGWFDRLRRIYLPLLAAPIFAAALLVALESIADFGAANRLGILTLSTGFHQQWFGLQKTDLIFFLSACLIVFTFVLVTPLALFSLRRPTAMTVLRNAGAVRASPRAALAIHSICLVSILPGFLLPLLLSICWTSEKIARVRFDSLYADVFGTLTTATAVTTVCLLLTLTISWLCECGVRARASQKALWLVALNLVTPPLVLACLLLGIGGWLGDFLLSNRSGLILADSIRFLPFLLIPVLDRMARVSSSITDSARVLGDTRRTSVFRTLLPLLKSSFALGAMLIFVLAAKELTISVFLQPFGYQALAHRIFALTGTQQTRESSIWILCSVIVCLYPLWALSSILVSERGRHA